MAPVLLLELVDSLGTLDIEDLVIPEELDSEASSTEVDDAATTDDLGSINGALDDVVVPKLGVVDISRCSVFASLAQSRYV
ncbi:MAG: hypothetical protein Q9219_002884 [cf. Caloplaca sp. 3 TL-2023]